MNGTEDKKTPSRHTLTEVARRIGVSASTVSRVVNNIGNVKPETREKVLEAMRTYRYVPNQVARNLKMSRSNAVGVVVPDINDPYFANIIKGMEMLLSGRGYSMILCISNEDGAKERKYLDFMMQNMIDCAVVATVSSVGDAHQRYLDSGRAMVFIDNLPGYLSGYDAVITDNEAASRLAVTHLHDRGHKNIAIIAGKQTETTGCDRLGGYLKAMRALGLPVRPGWVRLGDFKGESGYQAMRGLLLENPDVTAVYVNSSHMTYGACKAIQDAGLDVPGDVSVVGFDIHNNTGMMESSICSVVQQEDEIGRLACEMLFGALEGEPPAGPRKVLVKPVLIARPSVAAPRGGGEG